MAVLILKSDGTQEPFDSAKLVTSLTRAGASAADIQAVVHEIEQKLAPNTSTSQIYRDAFEHLRRLEAGTAARYSLKRAILEFGPSGFPFEAYLAELFRRDGYEAATNIIAHGACVEHEIDVLLSKGGAKTYVEAKFHNTPGFKTDLKVVLYVKARIDDIRKKEDAAEGMVVTNTKFTSMARRYGECAGLPLMGWDYPQKRNLRHLIEEANLYPVTALTSLSKKEKLALMSQKVVLCKGLLRHTETLRGLGLSSGRLKRLTEEVGALCPSTPAV